LPSLSLLVQVHELMLEVGWHGKGVKILGQVGL
jgi:hypothetical protein